MLQSNITEGYPQLQGKVVLSADDNEMNQLVLSKIMQKAGIKTVHAANGAEAVRKLKGGLKPDVIVMDLEMPVMNGVQASKIIKNKIDPHLPIVINSGSVSAYERSVLKHLGINDFLEKPYSIDDIYSKLAKNIVLVVT